MAFDATPISQPSDPIVGIDVQEMRLLPLTSSLFYRLRITLTSGATINTEKTVSAADFAAALGSFCQATPKKKFLTWLAANGYESNITPV